ncbi:hypothetical protein LYNGBM3L_05390 [Moorena producens 3L]|uniref:Uncharacterized protein n=1 Tax=Moorena producens 3L TaxID=489825 RepID=F4XRW4_9CYAN|nr:hypothetical protein LYNGBM3L_05390 [Moorena producens 3L]
MPTNTQKSDKNPEEK